MASNAQAAEDDQIPCRVLSSFGEKLYLKKDCADFYFTFDECDSGCIRIPAHKLLLTQSSDVFAIMFNGSWEEIDEVEIVDASVNAFKEFLQFFYLDRVKLTKGNVAEVMYLAKKYNVEECLEICVKFLRNSLNVKDIIWGYELAIKYEQKSLEDFCGTIVGLKTKEVFTSDSFVHCNIDVLGQILKLDGLNCSESELFKVCMQRIKAFGKNNELARNEAKQMIKRIRFGCMSFDEFIPHSISFSNFLPRDEYKEIIHVIGSKDFKPTLINGIRQKRSEGLPYSNFGRLVCDRMATRYGSHNRFDIKKVDTTTFSTNQTALLESVECTKVYEGFDLIHSNPPYFEFTIFEVPDGTNSRYRCELLSGKTVLHNEKRTTVHFNEPILIKKSFKYEFVMKPSITSALWTRADLKPEVFIEPDFTVKFYNDIPEDEIISKGLICTLKFIKI